MMLNNPHRHFLQWQECAVQLHLVCLVLENDLYKVIRVNDRRLVVVGSLRGDGVPLVCDLEVVPEFYSALREIAAI